MSRGGKMRFAPKVSPIELSKAKASPIALRKNTQIANLCQSGRGSQIGVPEA